MAQKTIWLRLSFWTAALADFIIAIMALKTEPSAAAGSVYIQRQFAVVAFCWGILLLIADRKPFEHRWVLIPTMLVVALLGMVAFFSLLEGLLSMSQGIPRIIASAAVFMLLAYNYHIANPAKSTG